MKKISVVITGSTGMVGRGVLNECLKDDRVEKVLVVNRSPLGLEHAKLKEVLTKDFFDPSTYQEALRGYNACFFCLGISSVGMKEPEYSRITYDLTKTFAEAFPRGEPWQYISAMSPEPVPTPPKRAAPCGPV